MKIITSKGQLTLPSGLSFSIEENSPFFSREGTQSIPITIPVSADTFAKLGYPTRIGRTSPFLRKLSAKLTSGIVHKDGQLVIDSVSSSDGIVCALMLNESDFYTKIKDVKLKDVFSSIIRDDFSESSDKVSAWYDYLYSVYSGSVNDDFNLFPVAVNKNEDDNTYYILNQPDSSSEDNPWQLLYKPRNITSGDSTTLVPAGYGVTPFLYLHKALDLLFAHYNYSVSSNPFRDNSPFSKIVLLNSCADTICKGKINYSDLVPDCTVSEFIDFLFAKFCCQIFISPESKKIDIRLFQDVVSDLYDSEITSYSRKNVKHTFSDSKQINLVQDTSLSGALPAATTIDELVSKYKTIKEVTEDEFVNIAWKYSLVLRKSTGEYYEMLRKVYSEGYTSRRLGTNYFNFYNNTLAEEKIEAKDPVPPMSLIQIGAVGIKKAMLLCPYIGDSIHRNTSYNSEDESTASQQIILCYDAGMAQENSTTAAKYRLGTTQKYNNLGYSWALYNLNTVDLYPLFWSRYDEMLMNCTEKISLQVDYTSKVIMSFRMDRLKLFSGVRLIPVKRSYIISEIISSGESEFIKVSSPEQLGLIYSFNTQLYGWSYGSDINTILAQYSGYERLEWSYKDGPIGSDEYIYLPAPTYEQYIAGTQLYQTSRTILILAFESGNTVPDEFEAVLHSGWTPILL